MTKKLNIFTVVLFLITFSSLSFADKGWRILAGMEEDFVHETTASIIAGALGPKDNGTGDAGLAYGVELSFNCPLLQPPTNKIRQQVSFLQYSDGDSTIQSVQINPHYVVEVAPKLWLGGGPGFGYVRADVAKKTANLVAAQVGASAGYSIDKIFIGAEARYQLTQNSHVGSGKDNGAHNWQTIVKVGYNFY